MMRTLYPVEPPTGSFELPPNDGEANLAGHRVTPIGGEGIRATDSVGQLLRDGRVHQPTPCGPNPVSCF